MFIKIRHKRWNHTYNNKLIDKKSTIYRIKPLLFCFIFFSSLNSIQKSILTEDSNILLLQNLSVKILSSTRIIGISAFSPRGWSISSISLSFFFKFLIYFQMGAPNKWMIISVNWSNMQGHPDLYQHKHTHVHVAARSLIANTKAFTLLWSIGILWIESLLFAEKWRGGKPDIWSDSTLFRFWFNKMICSIFH